MACVNLNVSKLVNRRFATIFNNEKKSPFSGLEIRCLVITMYVILSVCELVSLVCVRGSDKPLDLALLIDSSESIYMRFEEQIQFAIERIVQNLPLNPDAVRYLRSSQLFEHLN
jgi:hypothetical protein